MKFIKPRFPVLKWNRLLPLVLILLFNACIFEKEDTSFLGRLENFEFSVYDTLLLMDQNKTQTLAYQLKYLDKNNQELELDPNLDITFLINGQLSETLEISKETELIYDVFARIGDRKSNKVSIRVINPYTYVSKIELELDSYTRSDYAVTGSYPFYFQFKTYNYFGNQNHEEPDLIADGINKGSFYDGFTSNKPGDIEIWAEKDGVKSNKLTINYRNPISYPQRNLPVIFHVLHTGGAVGSINNPSQQTLYNNLNSLNVSFRNELPGYADLKSQNSVNTNIQFHLSEYAPNGRKLIEPGVNRVLVEQPNFNYDARDLAIIMHNTMWNPSQYINIFIVDLVEKISFTYLPSLYNQQLGGLYTSSSQNATLTYPYSLAINKEQLNSPYILAHEMGHYLGLLHVFSEEGKSCKNADFVTDTNDHIFSENEYAFKTDCNGDRYYSSNFMDYYNGVGANNFTFDQRARMEVVLKSALFIAKETSPNNRLIPFELGELDENIKPQICNYHL